MQAQHKILMVDDEPDLEQLIRQRMRREIRSGQYSFLFAGDGVEALETLGEHKDIDLVLSDINMPRMDGLTLLEKLPDVDTDLRSVVISAYGDMKNIRKAMNRGAFDFVTKPIDFDDLRVTINRGLRQLEMWREAEASRDKLLTLQSELDVANSMQQSILPKQFPKNEQYQLYGSMAPARNVGGDFFDIIRLEQDRIGIAIADVSDKGIREVEYPVGDPRRIHQRAGQDEKRNGGVEIALEDPLHAPEYYGEVGRVAEGKVDRGRQPETERDGDSHAQEHEEADEKEGESQSHRSLTQYPRSVSIADRAIEIKAMGMNMLTKFCGICKAVVIRCQRIG